MPRRLLQSFKLMITCEHASNELPARVKDLRIAQEDLDSHRGYDIGAFAVYENLVKILKPDFCSAGKYSRLYIDLNRSLRNNKSACEDAIAYHKSYWSAAEEFVARNLNDSVDCCPAIVHLAIHSFTPVLNGEIRNADMGVLYDSSNLHERTMADAMIDEIHSKFPHYKIRRNYPYLGKTDGLCSHLRKKYDPQKTGRYVGFEIEINQKLLR